jgi:hypothetical protein
MRLLEAVSRQSKANARQCQGIIEERENLVIFILCPVTIRKVGRRSAAQHQRDTSHGWFSDKGRRSAAVD